MSIKLVTHNGGFHADDLFAVATVKKFLLKEGHKEKDIEIIRTREPKYIQEADFVVDVGGIYDPSLGRYDHHQEGGAGERENGIPYAAFGLVWKQYGEYLTGEKEVAKMIDEKLVQTIDALDNGVDIFGEEKENIPSRYILQSAISSFLPTWNEKGVTYDESFFRALKFVETILEREIIQEKDKFEAIQLITESYKENLLEDKRLLLLDKDYPYFTFVEQNPEILFVIKPDKDNGNWKVSATRSSRFSFGLRKALPQEWAGKREEELAKASGVPDAMFAHNKRFMAVARSKEGAIELARRALKN